MYINKVTIYGRLGKDPELKVLPSGALVCNFTMATTYTYKDDNNAKKEETEWHSVVCYGKRAEVISKWVKKGDMFYVEGRSKTRTWDKDGQKFYKAEVIVEDFKFGDNPKREAAAPAEEYSGQPDENGNNFDTIGKESGTDEIDPDDIPF